MLDFTYKLSYIFFIFYQGVYIEETLCFFLNQQFSLKYLLASIYRSGPSLGPDQGWIWNINKKDGPLYSEPEEPCE